MARKKALNKDIRVEIKKSLGRYISIFLIVALGVSFFSGLRSTESDMRYTGDTVVPFLFSTMVITFFPIIQIFTRFS